jgi:hypothetical protein
MNKLLACDPLRLGAHTFTSLDDALLAIDRSISVTELAGALAGHDIPVSVRQLYRWKSEL